MELLAIFFCFLACSFASPTTKPSTCKAYTSDYDDLPANPLLPQLNTITTYEGLNYSGFLIANFPSPNPSPHSSPNALGASMVTNLLTLNGLTLYPFGTITPGPGTKTFSVESFWYSVDLDVHSTLIGPGLGAELVAYGFYPDGSQTPIKTLTYVPTALFNAPMQQATGFGDAFEGLTSFTIALKTTVGLLAALTSQGVVLLDDLKHKNC